MSVVGATEGSPASRLPRWLAAIIVGAIALASLTALIWPALPFNQRPALPEQVSVVSAQFEGAGMGGRIDAQAPDFAYLTPDGTTVRLSALQGKVIVVNFWATWCEPCRRELPAMNSVAGADPDVVFLAVASTGFRDTSPKVRSFFDQLGLDHLTPILDRELVTPRRYGVLSLPTTFFIGRDGVIRHLEIGAEPLTEGQIRRGIAKASGTEAPPPRSAPDWRPGVVVAAAALGAGALLFFFGRRRGRLVR